MLKRLGGLFATLGWLSLLSGCSASSPHVQIDQPAIPAEGPSAAPLTAPQTVGSLGVFETHQDVGAVKLSGNVSYDSETQTYTLSGSGENMWTDHDEFHYAWTRLEGDFIVRARMKFLGEGHESRKMGWTVRKSLDPQAMHVNASLHGGGLIDLQYRSVFGGQTLQATPALTSPDVVQLERRGNTYILSTARFGEAFVTSKVTKLDLGSNPYVGLSLCSHDSDALQQAEFSNVRIVRPAAPDFRPYNDYIGSNLELLDLASGLRRIIYRDPASIQAPNWTHDGAHLIYNRKGYIHQFNLASGMSRILNTGFATDNNNDHVLSWDGTLLAISHHVQDDNRQSTLYTLPLAGLPTSGTETPRQITLKGGGHSFLHGFSPDDKKLVFTGQRNDQYDIWTVDLETGKQAQLTNLSTLDDGSEYAPDGHHIYFNSVRTGSMEIWRMRTDGSEATQLTSDEYNNWFPHVSPDGSSIVMLSFLKDVEAATHPFYRQVYLRHMPIAGGPPRIIAYLYGGQGTINVPSWSPDGKTLAFVSNTRMNLSTQN